jgi:hypothetical protein
MTNKADPFDKIFGSRRGSLPGTAGSARRRTIPDGQSIRFTFSVLPDAESQQWIAAATVLTDDYGPLMNASSKHSPEDAAAQLWEKMARRIRERLKS